MRDLIGRALYAIGDAMHRAGLAVCGFAGWWDAGTDRRNDGA